MIKRITLALLLLFSQGNLASSFIRQNDMGPLTLIQPIVKAPGTTSKKAAVTKTATKKAEKCTCTASACMVKSYNKNRVRRHKGKVRRHKRRHNHLSYRGAKIEASENKVQEGDNSYSVLTFKIVSRSGKSLPGKVEAITHDFNIARLSWDQNHKQLSVTPVSDGETTIHAKVKGTKVVRSLVVNVSGTKVEQSSNSTTTGTSKNTAAATAKSPSGSPISTGNSATFGEQLWAFKNYVIDSVVGHLWISILLLIALVTVVFLFVRRWRCP